MFKNFMVRDVLLTDVGQTNQGEFPLYQTKVLEQPLTDEERDRLDEEGVYVHERQVLVCVLESGKNLFLMNSDDDNINEMHEVCDALNELRQRPTWDSLVLKKVD